MDVTKCEAFLAAIDRGSLTAAAEKLGYTQSGVTRMVNSLEEELGFPLFVRSKKGVILTENGKTMVPAFRSIVSAYHNASQVSSDIRGMVNGSLTIGSYFSISAVLMPTILKNFKERYPGIRIDLHEGGNREMTKWLNEKSVDCCLCAKPAEDTDCDWIPLFRDELVVWLPKNHSKVRSKKFPIRDLEKYPFIITSPNHDTDQDRLLASEHIHPDIYLATRDGYSTYNMVAEGLGISFNQRLISRKWDKSVVELPFDPPQYVYLGMAVPLLREVSPATNKFIECVKKTILH